MMGCWAFFIPAILAAFKPGVFSSIIESGKGAFSAFQVFCVMVEVLSVLALFTIIISTEKSAIICLAIAFKVGIILF
jgi:hypothetical protein